jgi:hypothetical protein
VLIEVLLDRPQVGRLPDEGAAMDAAKRGEPVAPVAAEVLVEALVGVDAEELTDAFDGEDLAVGQGRMGRAGAARRWPSS